MVDFEGDRRLNSAMIPDEFWSIDFFKEKVVLSNNTDDSNCETGIIDFLKATSFRLSAIIWFKMFIFLFANLNRNQSKFELISI